MDRALIENKSIIALTADVESFYHRIDSSFLLNEQLLQGVLGVELSESDIDLHRLFVQSMRAWCRQAGQDRGLPVGLPASAVVANLALIDFDRTIEREVIPLHYGRYVDDIVLVIENTPGLSTQAEFWNWLIRRSDGRLAWVDRDESAVQFSTSYLAGSQIEFSNKKNKVFFLEGNAGRVIVSSIARAIHDRASEWRSLADLPEDAADISATIVSATQADGDQADTLRDTNKLTMRRAGFALKLRDFEAYGRDLEPKSWSEHRLSFFRAFIEHIVILPTFFELEVYLPRVVQLAVSCNDVHTVFEIVRALKRLVRQVERDCDVKVKSIEDPAYVESQGVVRSWSEDMFDSVFESVVCAFSPMATVGTEAWVQVLKEVAEATSGAVTDLGVVQALHDELFLRDLGYAPYRFASFPSEFVSARGIVAGAEEIVLKPRSLLIGSVVDGLLIVNSWSTRPPESLTMGLSFSTRPYSMAELFLVARDPFSPEEAENMRSATLALRGFGSLRGIPQIVEYDGVSQLNLQVPSRKESRRIALSSWSTKISSWTAALTETEDPDRSRYQRLNDFLNELLVRPDGTDYIVMPELALPARWFMRIALKLHMRGISLITGIEYIHASDRSSVVRNQVWASLTHEGFGFPSMVLHRQDKQKPALHEESEIYRIAGVRLEPEIKLDLPVIIRHGQFSFAILVCSELTNIEYRSGFRGRIDALFVPEWNQDINTFESLVESAAIDIHAYIVQCNDRAFGDSRIRSPNKNSWQRDIIRIRGGVRDYIVIGDIDIGALRRFQSGFRSPNSPFKPLPDGFEMTSMRWSLPTRGRGIAGDGS
ncbi:RNA-directed DNA polymerase [Rhodococcus fascians]|nr:RNA-directed DNA polymerase [Rhodococcus fascians]MBY4023883.1 RNA-directed DNA polymerase [Rhodococcus fascians]